MAQQTDSELFVEHPLEQTSTNTYAGLTYDWDNDQTDDIFIVNYNQPNQLFMGVRNQGIVIPGAFTEVTTDPITLDSKPSIGATTFARLFPAVFRCFFRCCFFAAVFVGVSRSFWRPFPLISAGFLGAQVRSPRTTTEMAPLTLSC